MVKRVISRSNSQILEEASAWFVELSEGLTSQSARAAFDDWLRISPEHVRAFLQISALWEDAPRLGLSRSLDAPALIEWVMTRPSVVKLAEAQALPRRHVAHELARGWRLHRRWAALAASLVLMAAGLGTWVHLQQGLYTTGIGEQRLLALPDGSTIYLNARSRLRVRFSARERSVDLLDGQALFHVVANAQRPFIVRSGPARIRDIGTQFDVDHQGTETIITVVEGRVSVRRQGEGVGGAVPHPVTRATPLSAGASGVAERWRTGPPGLELTAGEQVTVTPMAVTFPARADIPAAIAWTQRMLVFMSSPLGEVAREYNRYHDKPLVIRDPALDTLRVSGVFSVTDSAALIAFLRAQPDVDVKETSQDIEVLGR